MSAPGAGSDGMTGTDWVPRWTSTSIVPPGAQALRDLAAKAVGDDADADAAAYRLYEQIRREVAQVSGMEDARRELRAYQALVRCLMEFAKDRLSRSDDTAKCIYATIARFSRGGMFRPGRGADSYLIPVELTDTTEEGR